MRQVGCQRFLTAEAELHNLGSQGMQVRKLRILPAQHAWQTCKGLRLHACTVMPRTYVGPWEPHSLHFVN